MAAAAAEIAAALQGAPLFGLVNNAGGILDSCRSFGPNVVGVQLCSAAFAPLMQPGSRIVNIGSGAGTGFVRCFSQD